MKTTKDLTEGMTVEEVRRYEMIGIALVGIRSDRAVALLMSAVCAVIDQVDAPSLWLAIESGAKEEIRLWKQRGPKR